MLNFIGDSIFAQQVRGPLMSNRTTQFIEFQMPKLRISFLLERFFSVGRSDLIDN